MLGQFGGDDEPMLRTRKLALYNPVYQKLDEDSLSGWFLMK